MKFLVIFILPLIYTSEVETIFTKCDKSEANCKVTYRVSATYANDTQEFTHDLFSLTTLPINKCKVEDCDFCCLSTNKCGSKKQCENSEYFMFYINSLFYFVMGIIILSFIIKCFQIDSYPEQLNQDKIENLNELINMFGIIKNNRTKLIS